MIGWEKLSEIIEKKAVLYEVNLFTREIIKRDLKNSIDIKVYPKALWVYYDGVERPDVLFMDKLFESEESAILYVEYLKTPKKVTSYEVDDDMFICKVCGETLYIDEASEEDDICCSCYERLGKEHDEDIKDLNSDYMRSRI